MRICFVCKRGDCWSTRYIKEECDEAREGFKRRVHQYFIDNNINKNFNKDITAIAFNILTLTIAPTTTSSNFFYNDYSAKHFMTLNGLIPIKTAKNIVMSMNNNAFTYGLTGGIEPDGIKCSTARHSNVSNGSSNDKGKSATYFCDDNNNNNPPDLTVNINFLDCHLSNNE